jgi:hypothetical protein
MTVKVHYNNLIQVLFLLFPNVLFSEYINQLKNEILSIEQVFAWLELIAATNIEHNRHVLILSPNKKYC